jgi:hypothetical protein
MVTRSNQNGNEARTMNTWVKLVQFLRKRTSNPHFNDPDYVADVMLLGTVYSTATVLK